MDHKENKSDSEIDDTSADKTLLDDENSKDVKNKSKKQRKLTNSPPQVAGTGSSGEKRGKIKITPSDATGYVRSSSGKLTIDTKAISEENITLRSSVSGLTEERDSLLDEIAMLNAKLESLENPGGHPVPDPSKDDSKTVGSEGAISKSQFEELKEYIAETVKLYQDAQAAAKTKGNKINSKSPSDPRAPGPSGAGSPHTGSAAKISSKASRKDMLGPSVGGDDSDDDTYGGTGSMDSSDDDDDSG